MTSPAPMHDLKAMLEAYRRAFDSKDATACAGFFAEDASLRFLSGSYSGRPAIEEWHKDRFAADVSVVHLDEVIVEGDTVVAHAVASSRRLRLFRINQLKGTATFRVAQGQFVEASFSPRKGVLSHLDWQFR
jgi:hypothetical protein